MEDKAGAAAEGSSIFESLFGGFSNGLSIFTNNPFRRKQEVVASKADAESEKFSNGGCEPAMAQVTAGMKAEDTVTDVSPPHKTRVESEVRSKSRGNHKHSNEGKGHTESEVQGEGDFGLDDGRLKKVKREEDISSENKKKKKTKKKRTTEVADENLDEQGVNVVSDGTRVSERQKRKQETSESSAEDSVKIEVEGTGSVEGKQSKKKKKKIMKGDWGGDEDAKIEPVKTPSEHNQKKRPNEEAAEGQEIAPLAEGKSGEKERKIGSVEEITAVKVKRSLDLDVVEEQNKKIKLVVELNDPSPRVNERAETPQKSEQSTETKAGTKRKVEDELERNYEKKLRGSLDFKEDKGIGDMDADSKSKGKRKIVGDDDDEFLGGKGKKRRLTKQQKIDNEAKLRRTIFVGNIPVNVKAKHLSTEFSQYGAVESARLRSIPIVDVKMPRRAAVITGNVNENRTSLNGYVVFKEEASAEAALAHNMKEFGGKHLRVDLAGSRSSRIEYDRKRSIFVGNLPFDTEDEDLITLFQGSTPELEVEAVRVVRDPQTSAGKGFAFVSFKTKLGAEAALDKKDFIMFKNRHLRLERFGFKITPQAMRVTRVGPKSKEGAVQRISSKKGPAPYEGERVGKRKGVTSRTRERGGSSTPNKSGRRAGLPKRPAVAAKKARALQMKAGGASGSKVSVGKRKKEEKGKKKVQRERR